MGKNGISDISLEDKLIFNIMRFKIFHIILDLSKVEEAQAEMERLTSEVDRECPVSLEIGDMLIRGGRLKKKGTEAVKGPGEGIVWTCPEHPNLTGLWFKTKGESHCSGLSPSAASGTALSPADGLAKVSLAVERASGVTELLDRCLRDARMRQGLEFLAEMGRPIALTSLPAFISWVVEDLLKEERDTIQDSGLKADEVRKAAKARATAWFKEHVAALQAACAD